MTIEFIENPANAEKVEAMSMLSDIYKDAYGSRPRGIYNVEAMTVAEIYHEIDELHKISMENMEQEAIWEAMKVEEFKTLIAETIKLGADDEKTALKWLFDASGIEVWSFQDVEHFVWQYGILFTDYAKHILTVLTELYHEGELPKFKEND